MSNLKTLNGRKSQDILLQDAIAACQSHFHDSAIALLYSPTACQFAKLVGGNLIDSAGKVINQPDQRSPIFEARIFNKTSELRWLNVRDGYGHAVLISESNILEIFANQCDLTYFETLQQQYILWGQGIELKDHPPIADGWSRLGAARIGAMDIPFANVNSNKQRVKLKAIEYFQEVDKHGNVAVVEERLVGIEIL